MSQNFSIFVDKEQIYSGNFEEVPDEYREKIVEALNDWGEVLGKNGLNEMIFSLFTWYGQKHYQCPNCNERFEEQAFCSECREDLISINKYTQNEKISGLLNCIGMITHLEIGR
ncbi:MAG: zinc-ribbon domain-containing protein [Thermodesulfobacteriota bacterium]